MRCSRHDLALGPDGRCVLCRRNSLHPVSPPEQGPPSLPPVIAPRSVFLAVALVFALGGAGAAWAVRSPSASPADRAEQTVAIDSEGASAGVLSARRPIDSEGASAGVLSARRPIDSEGASAGVLSARRPIDSEGASAGVLSARGQIDVATDSSRAQPANLSDTASPSAVEAAASPTDPATDARLRALLAMSDPRGGDPRAAAQPSRSTGAAGSPDVGAEAPSPQRPVHVIVYTTSWCPSCRAAKSWLQKNGVAYEERDIEASRTYAAQMRALNPRGSIPTFDVEGDVSVGFSSSWLVATLRKHGSAPD